jgi:hypothetical protein
VGLIYNVLYKPLHSRRESYRVKSRRKSWKRKASDEMSYNIFLESRKISTRKKHCKVYLRGRVASVYVFVFGVETGPEIGI